MKKDDERLMTSAGSTGSGPADYENPLDFIAGDHMREREVCTLIDRLVAEGRLQASETRQITGFLTTRLPDHLDDEEIDLFPMMRMRCEAEDEIEKVIEKLRSDHTHAFADAPAIAALIEGAGAGAALSDAERALMTGFADHARRHLILENAVVLPIARARLTGDDLATMKRHMLARRGLAPSEGAPSC